MELRLEINSDIELRLNRLVERYGHDREYYLSELKIHARASRTLRAHTGPRAASTRTT